MTVEREVWSYSYKFHFLLKSTFQVMSFFIVLEVGYLVTIVVNFVCKRVLQLFSRHYKICLIGLYFRNIFLKLTPIALIKANF